MLAPQLETRLLSEISALKNENISIVSVQAEGGGCINQAYTLETTSGKFFLKTNHAGLYPRMFEKEALGLQALSEAGEIFVPRPLVHGDCGDISFLLLEHIRSSSKMSDFWEDFGRSLALLHKHSSDLFGLEYDNYIGSLEQNNRKHNNWIPLAGNEEHPSLLHGDLWSGNYMVSSSGKPCLIDPAIYYGHREMDISMTRLFGGFAEAFYSAYNNEFPLESGWNSRSDVCNLYPLMVHVNLFGGSYLRSVKEILKNNK